MAKVGTRQATQKTEEQHGESAEKRNVKNGALDPEIDAGDRSHESTAEVRPAATTTRGEQITIVHYNKLCIDSFDHYVIDN